MEAVAELVALLERFGNRLESWTGDDALPSDPFRGGDVLAKALGHPPDLVARRLDTPQGPAMLLYLEGLVDTVPLLQGVVAPLEAGVAPAHFTLPKVAPVFTRSQALEALLAGHAVCGSAAGGWWAVDVAKPPQRSVAEPPNATVVHGPHVGFVEVLAVNLGLLRQYLATPALRAETLRLGGLSENTVALVHLMGVAPAPVLRWLRRRLKILALRGMVDSSRLAQALAGPAWLPLTQYSERPDQVAAALLQGRAAILVDHSPSVLLVPARLTDLLSSPGDYYQMPLTGSITRCARYVGLLIATTLPAVFVAAITVNPAFIPLALYLTTVRTRLSIPFPAVVETLILLGVVDVVQEAGLIMPGALGQTVTIFGTLILGNAAIQAGIVSAPTLITVTLAILAQYLVPDANLSNVLRVLRYALIPVAAVFGFVGVVTAWMALLAVAVRVQSAQVAYLAPLSPWRPGGWRDTVVRWPRQTPGRR
ncbi:MAG: spore germination protein [Firmicutes bacterium]|nr:spore germination protein [Alicyclobacillaceae bacterium]MCL6497280.1 spore germination protein [Bacillota bacterium]